MDRTASKVLIETIVRKTIRDIKESPERSTRNLVDLALQASRGRFQKHFFSVIQTMLQNENSSYYRLVHDSVTHVDVEKLVTFGMNLGYHSCTLGANTIRKNEEKLHCNIPWMFILHLNEEDVPAEKNSYQRMIQEGRDLGIFSWTFFADACPQALLPLADSYPDCAFFLFCNPKDVTEDFTDAASAADNVMIAVRYGEGAQEACERLRRSSMLYSIYYPYSDVDIPMLENGDLFCDMEQLHPIFSVLAARSGCSDEVRRTVSDIIAKTRESQKFQTVLWETDSDNRMIDAVISGDACTGYFDSQGRLFRYETSSWQDTNLFAEPLQAIFQKFFPK